MRIGGAVFVAGALATVITVAPLFLGIEPFPAPAYFVCMLMGLGFALAAAGLVRSALAQRRTAATAAESTAADSGESGNAADDEDSANSGESRVRAAG